MDKLSQMRASDNAEDGVEEFELAKEKRKPESELDSFKEDYFERYSDIKISIKEDW